ncbi:MAG: 3-dehydroquinate synthase [Pseudomonadota bacterium]
MPFADRVIVDLADRSYPIHITEHGLEGLGRAMGARFPAGPVFVVTNPVVTPLYLEEVAASLHSAGFEVRPLQIPDGEEHKDATTWLRLLDALLEGGLDRRTPVVALGGGVTGDLVGFAAATALRGVPFVQVPTTLLAMVDASVGGKTGFNTPQGKNLIGAFHQPRLVFSSTHTLATLPDEEWRSGMGEALKHGVIRDASLVAWMREHAEGLRRRDPSLTVHIVRRCCEIKAGIVAEDEREAGLRAILNFGHTAGHALETALGHGAIRHGEAVALGMLVEARLALAMGWCTERDLPARLRSMARALGLPTSLAPWGLGPAGAELSAKLDAALRMDKKTVRGTLTFVAPVTMGEVRLVRATSDTIATLREMILTWETEP